MGHREYGHESWYPGERFEGERGRAEGRGRGEAGPDPRFGTGYEDRYDPAETGTGMSGGGGSFGRGYGGYGGSEERGYGAGREGYRARGSWQEPGPWRERGPWQEDETWRAGGLRGSGRFAPWGTSEGSDEGSGYGRRGDRASGDGGRGYGSPGYADGGYGTSFAGRGGYEGAPGGGMGGSFGEPGGGWARGGPGEANFGGRYTGRGPKGYQRSRERILDDVCQRLADHPEIDASEMEVDVQGDVVFLRGQAHDRGQKRMAEDVAETVSGVRDVRNELDVEKGMLATLTDAVSGRSRDDEDAGDVQAPPRKARAGSASSRP